MPDFYSIRATGRQDVNGTVLQCPDCGQDTNLTFTTPNTLSEVTGSCPRGHIWNERLLPAVEVRRHAINASRR